MVTAVSLGAIAQATFFRIWLIGHIPINSDEAVTGLMARAILHGHVTAFYWGQSYGGVEPFLDAAAFAVLPKSGVTLHAVTAAIGVMGVMGVVMLWCSARQLLASRPLALSVAAVSLLFPTFTLLILTQAYGFRATTYALSFALLLAALWVDRRPEGPWRWLNVGLVAGVGWWSSPEIVYLGIAAGCVVVVAWWRDRTWSLRARRALLVLGGAVVGSLPWWWFSLRTGFDTLRNHGTMPSTYGERLGVFFSHVLPQMAGLQQTLTGRGIGVGTDGPGHLVAVVGLSTLIVAAALSAIVVGGPRRAIGLAVLLSPFAYAASPAAWYFADGRYAIYLLPLYVLVLAIGLERLVSWPRLRLSEAGRVSATTSVTTLVVLAAMVWSSWQFSTWVRQESGTPAVYFSGYTASDAGMVPVARSLAQAGYTVGWANYWVAYRLDFLGGGALSFSPTPTEDVRSAALYGAALRSPHSVWLVTGPGVPGATEPRNNDPAPGGVSWGSLKRRFEAAGVGWSIERVGVTRHVRFRHGAWVVRHVGGIWVIVPDRRVLPAGLGLGPRAP